MERVKLKSQFFGVHCWKSKKSGV